MFRKVTLEDVQEAVDQLVAEGYAKVVQPCTVVVPASWKQMLPKSAFVPIEPMYQTTNRAVLMKKAIEEIHACSTQSWIRRASREALDKLKELTSDTEIEDFAQKALADIAEATSVSRIKMIAKPFQV